MSSALERLILELGIDKSRVAVLRGRIMRGRGR
jgi:hypothetical protein